MPKAYGYDCMDIVLYLLSSVENEEVQIINYNIYGDL